MEARASRLLHTSAHSCSKPRPAHAHATVLFCCHNEFCSFIVAAAHVPDDARDSPAEARAQLSASALRMCCWRSQVSTVVAVIQVSCIFGAVSLLDVAVAAATLAAAAVRHATLAVASPPSPLLPLTAATSATLAAAALAHRSQNHPYSPPPSPSQPPRDHHRRRHPHRRHRSHPRRRVAALAALAAAASPSVAALKPKTSRTP